jgi:hypothetical protein
MKQLLLFVSLIACTTIFSQTNIVTYGSSWKYLDKGTNQGTAWKETAFNDASWASGNAQLGYGDGDEATVVSYGPNSGNKYITTYFRKTISVANASSFTSFTLNVKRDDGAVVYINGTQRFRSNMPTGTITYTTRASSASDDGNTAQIISLPAGSLINGSNVIAVEIHQSTITSSDISFDLQLTGVGVGGGDLTPPIVSNYSPTVNATNVPISNNLALTFNETVQKGTGNILIKEGGVITQTIDVTSTAVTVAGNVVTINPSDFGYTKAVNIELAAGVFKDLANNNYAGITNATTWTFNTENQVSGPQSFISYGASWKYLDNGSNQGTAWITTSFNDAAWASGNAQLGYGDGDEATVLSYGASSTAKYITTYFRKAISISNPLAFSAFSGSVKRDDGIIIYVNGSEVYRNNMPTGNTTYTTLASAAASDDGNTAQNFTISPAALVSGNNIIAVEMHQNAGTSSDLSFDLELLGTTGEIVPDPTTLTRGPYLNSALQNGIIIRWRSDLASNSKVNYGTTAGNLTQSYIDNTVTTEHVVTLTGLTTNTLYYYSIGSTSQTLQGDANNYFKTMPAAGSTQKIRIMAMGDMGNNSTNQVNVRNAWQAFNGSNYTDAWILLGDNAYNTGTDAEFQTNFFNIYQGSLTKNHVLWPSPGNHEYADNAARQADHLISYYDMFSLPKNGEAGGVASGTEAYYSYNYGNVHFVALDSYGWETGSTRLYDTLGPQASWLKQDLATKTQPWTVVYFHHPPYSKGNHNSDADIELINMRQKIVPILERFKVDLVLNGHSHDYERSYLLNGHYGLESSFNLASHALSSSSAKYDGTANSCTYIKNASDLRNGIVYAVVGSAGQLGGTTTGYPHNAMYYSNVTNGGTLYFEVENNRLAAKWIGADGVIRDNFNIMKNVNQTKTTSIISGSSATLTASWIGNYSWSTGATTKSIIVSPAVNTTYTVTDGAGCLTDLLNVEVTSALRSLSVQQQSNSEFKVYPTILQKGQFLHVQSGYTGSSEYILLDARGKILGRKKTSGDALIPTGNLLPGIYFLKGNVNNKTMVRKFVVAD